MGFKRKKQNNSPHSINAFNLGLVKLNPTESADQAKE
jgi:hypothetical protein